MVPGYFFCAATCCNSYAFAITYDLHLQSHLIFATMSPSLVGTFHKTTGEPRFSVLVPTG